MYKYSQKLMKIKGSELIYFLKIRTKILNKVFIIRDIFIRVGNENLYII